MVTEARVRIAASYARISGPKDERTASLESQEEAIVAKLESLGYTVPQKYRYREKWSGVESIYERQVLINCRQLLASGEVQALGVYDTDRLARDPDQLTAVVGDAIKHHADVVFTKLDGEWGTHVGKTMLYMNGFVSISEIDATKDRTARGRLKKWDAGVHMGQGRPRYGYRRDREARRFEVNPETSPVVVRIFESLAAGCRPADVCRMLTDERIPTPFGKSLWSDKTLRVIVRERTYYGECVGRRTMSTGKKRANGTTIQVPRPADQRKSLSADNFPPLVSRELWERANAGLDAAAAGPRSPRGEVAKTFLLSGILRCGCGFRMSPHRRKSGTYRAYRCSGGSIGRGDRGNGCRKVRGAAKLEEEVWRRVVDFIRDDGQIEGECRRVLKDRTEATIRRDLAAAEKARKKVQRDAGRLLDLMMQAKDSAAMAATFDARRKELDEAAGRLDAQIKDLRGRLVPFADREASMRDFAAKVRALREQISVCESVEDRRTVLIGLGVSVVAAADEVAIHIDPRFAGGNAGNTPST
jgi:DNA invertase Pin-like site-specific DNA recombinase